MGAVLSEALARASDATTWMTFALGKLEAMRATLSRPTIVATNVDKALFASLDTHFHVGYVPPDSNKDSVARTRSRIGQLIVSYRAMMNVIANATTEFVEDMADPKSFAKAFPGGMTSTDP
jgi:hypothetical protein